MDGPARIIQTKAHVMKNKARKIDLSMKLLQMGQALQEEGEELKDSEIITLGIIFIFLASLPLDDREIYKFADMVEMFSAKSTFDNLTRNHPDIMAQINGLANKSSYDDLINKLQKRKEQEENNEDEENFD